MLGNSRASTADFQVLSAVRMPDVVDKSFSLALTVDLYQSSTMTSPSEDQQLDCLLQKLDFILKLGVDSPDCGSNVAP